MPEENLNVSIGGSVETAIRGEYSIDIRNVLFEAWQQTLKSRLSINLGLFLILLLGMLVSFFVSNFFGGIELVIEQAQEQNSQALQLVNAIVTIAVWPFIAGVEMMGVYHAIKKPTKTNMVLSFLNRGSWVALCALLTSILISIGFQLLVLPGLLLAVLLSLTIPLVVEKKFTPMQAIIVSIKALRFKIWSLLAIYFVLCMALISLLFPIALLLNTSLAPLAIMVFLYGLSYIAPWYYNVKGILYREIFGVYVAQNTEQNNGYLTDNDTGHNGSDDTFSA
ncbi:hypothetical protein AADZ84_15825 [Colwelliaceae bacterium MEBiC 14330]